MLIVEVPFVKYHMWDHIDHVSDESYTPSSKVNGANVGPTWVLSAPDGPHVAPLNLVIRDYTYTFIIKSP